MFPQRVRPYAYLALAVLGYSLEPIALKVVVQTMSIGQINFWLCLFATLGMGAIVLLERRASIFRTYSKLDIFRILAIGAVGMFMFNVLITYGFGGLPASEATSLKYIWPVILALIAVPVMREHFSMNKVLGALLGFLGILVLANGGLSLAFSVERPDAVAAVLAAAVCWAVFNIMQKKQNYEAFTSVFLMSAFALAMFTPFMLMAGPVRIPTLTEFIALAYLGIVAFGVALAFYFKALQTGDTAKIAALSYATPFLTLVWAAVLLGETIYWYYPLALCFVVAGALLQLARRTSSMVRQTQLPDSRFYDLTAAFSGTRSPAVYAAMKGGGSVIAMRMPDSSLPRLPMPYASDRLVVFSESQPVGGVSPDEMDVAREAVGAGSEETVVFAVGETNVAARALGMLNARSLVFRQK